MAERIIFHADDYGANKEISQQILDCCKNGGALNSLSVLPNSPDLEECMELLAPYRERLEISVHLNLAEGPSAADPRQIPWLVDRRGMFSISFLKVLLLSFTGRRRELKRQIRIEMEAQIGRMLPYVNTLRIDSHQHYHMIPIVLESILEVVGAGGAVRRRKKAGASSGRPAVKDGRESKKMPEIEFIRIPAEPVLPFLKQPAFYRTYRPVNLVKQAVLRILYRMDRKLLAPYQEKSAVFFGILLSGSMDLKRVETLLPDFRRIADKRGIPLEVLCHPGGVKDARTLMDSENRDCASFYTAPGRRAEKDMLLHIARRR